MNNKRESWVCYLASSVAAHVPAQIPAMFRRWTSPRNVSSWAPVRPAGAGVQGRARGRTHAVRDRTPPSAGARRTREGQDTVPLHREGPRIVPPACKRLVRLAKTRCVLHYLCMLPPKGGGSSTRKGR
eukprot:293533-Chlamydomonas_euryale.AAC.3